ncbi:MAG TPA: WbqC family protein [Bryobacteraceae bacterium]|jgi:hypothetical protein|nr:WbqC family protein [Bryobacteraceae bacterium]
MNCVILQPSYIPWRGYFHQIQKADTFVFYDDVQYEQGRSWRNRNRIKTAAGSQWLTIPLQSHGAHRKDVAINEMRTQSDGLWRHKHWETIRHSYSRAPYFAQYRSMIEGWYRAEGDNLAEFTIATTIELASALGIGHTRFVRSSSLSATGAKTPRLLSILRALGATRYISGPAARDYLDVVALESAGIAVEWMTYEYPEYPQLFPPFDPQVSILDLLLNTGPSAAQFIWAK